MRRSIWQGDSTAVLEPLRETATADVCVIGAGAVGLAAAYLLARERRSVLVIDDGPIAGGETCRSSAHLVTALDRGWQTLVRDHGLMRARLAAESHRAAIETIERIAREESLACDFSRLDGYLCAGERVDRLRRELEAARSVGLDVDWIASGPFDGSPAIRYRGQAQIDPLRYAVGLAGALRKHGGSLRGARAESIEGAAPEMVVRTREGATIRARHVVDATNAPIAASLGLSLKMAAYRTYVVAGRIPRGRLPRALYWDLEEPFHYVRQLGGAPGDEEVLLVGGEDHRTGQETDSAAQRWQRLVDWARDRLPEFGDPVASWSGQVIESMDGLAFIGAVRPGLWVATGDSGNGLTHAMVAGLLIADGIVGRENAWSEVYDPRRVRLSAAGEFLRENASTGVQYLSLVSGGDVDRPEAIPPGSGAVLRRGLKKLAVFRDRNGEVFERSAICPHLGCVVAWNGEEESWDCPCHGSRFDPLGRLLNGPANRDLAPSREITQPTYAFSAVILDVDGTLLDSNDAHAEAWVRTLADFDMRVDLAAIRPLIGMGGDQLLPRATGIDAESGLGKRITERRGELFRTRYLPHLRPFAGTRELLLDLRSRGKRLIVASSSQASDLDGLLRQAGVADLIEESVSSSDAERSKPHPDIVSVAIERSGERRAAHVMIGDTPYDVTAGARAGIPVIALECGGWEAPDLVGAIRVYRDPAALRLALRERPLGGWLAAEPEPRRSVG